MALKKVKPNSSGGRNKARWVTRTEAKDGARLARRKEDKASKEEAPDVRVYNHGSIWTIHPMTAAAWSWLDTNLGPSCPRLGDAFAIEARYIVDILDGLTGDGLTMIGPR